METKNELSGLQGMVEFGFDGRSALRKLIEQSIYRSLEQAVASLSLFPHPDTVKQARTMNIFAVIRCQNNAERGKYTTIEGNQRVMLCDNKSPTDAFIWAHNIKRSKYQDVQFNHVWNKAKDVKAYTNLANICMMPAFLSKLADADAHICAVLRYRAYSLFGYHPDGVTMPNKPAGYDAIVWADPLPLVSDLEGVYRNSMSTRKDRTTRSAKEIGWLFSDFQPDQSL